MAKNSDKIKLTEIHKHAVLPPQKSFGENLMDASGSLARATGRAAYTVGKYALLATGIILYLGLIIASGGGAAGSFGDFQEDRKEKKAVKKAEKRGEDIVYNYDSRTIELNKDDIVMAEEVTISSDFTRAGAKTKVYTANAEEIYITQPKEFLQKLGCNV
ncbi:MAG TPA: hypothetical protein EYG18_04225 [Micavibrio sp.]|nr:hypothetical protein [Micavibrio sp.]HIL28457.1 hypothetical protein [Micavibrio sp.]